MDRIIAKFIEKHENRFFTFFITQSHKNYTRIYRGYHTITYKSYYFNGTIDPFLAYAKMDRCHFASNYKIILYIPFIFII